VRRDEFDCNRRTGDLWQMTTVGPTGERVDPDRGNEEYRRLSFGHLERAGKRDEPVCFRMHPKQRAMMGFDHGPEAVRRPAVAPLGPDGAVRSMADRGTQTIRYCSLKSE